MHLAIVDYRPEYRAALLGRVREALRQAEIRRFQPIEVDRFHLDRFDWTLAQGVVLGPGCQNDLSQVVGEVRLRMPVGRIGVVLKKDEYRARAMQLRIELGVITMAEGDLAQLVSFVIECDRHEGGASSGGKNRGVIGLCHFKGGVGCTSLTAALAACWARHDLTVAMIDLDDVAPHLTVWSQADQAHRLAVSEFIRLGEIPENRLNETLYPVEGYRGRLVIVPQPETYGDGFHFKSNSIPDAPGIRTFVESLLIELKKEFDIVIIDLGRSWGIATFITLSMCQKILLIMDDDPIGMAQTLKCSERIMQETNNDALLGVKNWNIVLNSYTGLLVTPKELQNRLEQIDLFPPSRGFFVIPYSRKGRVWGSPGKTLYEMSDINTREKIAELAMSCVSFVRNRNSGIFERVRSVFGV